MKSSLWGNLNEETRLDSTLERSGETSQREKRRSLNRQEQ